MTAEKGDEKMDKFIKRGEEILNTFSMSIKAFESQTNKLKEIEKTVCELKRKLNDDDSRKKRKNRNMMKKCSDQSQTVKTHTVRMNQDHQMKLCNNAH